MGCLGNHPLQDAGVFPASGDQVTVVVQEGNVGHVTAVTTVLVARSLKGKQKKKKKKLIPYTRGEKEVLFSTTINSFKNVRKGPLKLLTSLACPILRKHAIKNTSFQKLAVVRSQRGTDASPRLVF